MVPPYVNDVNSIEQFNQVDCYISEPRNISILVLHPQLTQQFPNLQFINFADSQIVALVSDSFERCDELRSLYLNGNTLTSIPPRTFQNCSKLRFLELTLNSQAVVDGEIFYGLQNLEMLRIGGFTVSNKTFEYLQLLRELYLTDIGGIESNALRHLSQLEFLEISDNSLSLNVIEDAIDGMQNLWVISLERNRYTSFNFSFFEQFENLIWFDLNGNQLTTIPENSFKNYRNLEVLRLNSNHISTLTEQSFAGLHKLDSLTLNNNRLQHLSPNWFSELVNLRYLDLSYNNIPQIDPGTFNGLQSLETLLLNNMQLENLTSGMFEPLQSLRSLQIMEGRITNIPPNTFKEMKNLRELLLYGNMITRLNSNSFGFLPLLESFLISRSVLGQGINEIERNFFNNFPMLVRFGGFGNVCFDGIVNITSIDFAGETQFDQCFLNWEGAGTTTTTTEMITTPTSRAFASKATLWLLITIIAIKATLSFE